MDIEEWIHQANDCIHLNLTRPTGASERIFDEPFNPSFTYAIFDDTEENIIGYKEPRITLDFRANDLSPSLNVKYKQKADFSAIPGIQKQVDIETVFNDFLPASAFDPSAPAAQTSGPDPTSKSWKPPGKRLHDFEINGKQYEIWTTSLADPAGREIWRNMEILVLMFIEGASKLELDEDWTAERWTLHLLYEVTPLKDSSVSPYTIAGFSTSHRYWVFPTFEIMRAIKSLPSPPHSANGDATTYKPARLELAPVPTEEQEGGTFKEQLNPLDAPSRERISQFLILPPYQGQSLGSKLYETLFQHYHKQPNIYEIPVEDPSEAFDAMRDLSDIQYLRSVPAFRDLELASSIPPESLRKDAPIPRDLILGNGADLTALRHETKIVPRQFNRLVELHVFSKIPPLHRNRARLTRKDKSTNENDRKYYFWRLALKDRIYRQNSAELDEVRKEDPKQAVDVLENAVDSQQDEYIERLEAIEKRGTTTDNEEGTSGSRDSHPARSYKRKRVVVDEDDWEDVDDESVASSKKARN